MYPFLQKRRTLASVLDSGYWWDILCGSLVPCCKKLQGLFWVLSQVGNMSQVNLGSNSRVAVLSNITGPVCYLFIPAQTAAIRGIFLLHFLPSLHLAQLNPSSYLQPSQPKSEVLQPSISGPSSSVGRQIHYEPIISKRLQMCNLTRAQTHGRINLT